MLCLFHIVVFTNGSFVALEREGLVGISYSKEAKDQNSVFLTSLAMCSPHFSASQNHLDVVTIAV